MMQIYKKAVLFLLIIIMTTTACSLKNNNKVTQAEKQNQIIQNYLNNLSKEDKKKLQEASPEDIIKMYYDSINDKKYDLAIICASCFLKNSAIKSAIPVDEACKEHLNYLKRIKKIELKSIEEYNPPASAENMGHKSGKLYCVYYIQEAIDSNEFAVFSGKFTRFITVEKSPLYNGWCISSIDSSP